MERDLAEREKAVVQGEGELNELRAKADAFPKDLETAVSMAVKEAADRLTSEAANKEELLKREFQGQENVLKSKIESLEKTVTEQSAQVAALSAQLEKSYVQVQDIAVKAIEGSSNVKAFGYPQPVMAEQAQRSGQGDK
jgi:phage-related minor tail protein